jgi:membrane-associated phospholipid phosphatase
MQGVFFVNREFRVRADLLVIGFALVMFTLYAAGKWVVPLVDGADKAILAAINPDQYTPVLDEFVRAYTDYSNFLISIALLSLLVATLLYRSIGGDKRIYTGLLAVLTCVMTAYVAMGKFFPNKVLTGANIFHIVWMFATLSAVTYIFHKMSVDGMRRYLGIFWLVLISIYLTDLDATERIKSTISRPRPLNVANKPWNEQVRVIPEEKLQGNNSFPSGHTSGTFGLLTPIFWWIGNRKARAGLIGLGVLQAFARVYTAAHFPFCVTMGAFAGFSIGSLVFFTLGGPQLRRPSEETASTS